LVVEEGGRLGVGEGRCEPVVVESGSLGMELGEDRCALVVVENGRLGMVLDEGRCAPVVVERSKSICLLKFQMGN
jgi:hypothetical protein